MQITDPATARVEDILHLPFAGLPVEVSLYIFGRSCDRPARKQFHADVKVVPKLQIGNTCFSCSSQ